MFRLSRRSLGRVLLALSMLLGLWLPLHGGPAPTPAIAAAPNLQQEFAAAAQEFGVPQPVLMAVAYSVSRWEQHAGQPSTSGGYGIMHLTDVHDAPSSLRGLDAPGPAPSQPELHTLRSAATLIGADPAALKTDRQLNLRAGAALLAEYARQLNGGALPTSSADWYGAVVRYSGFHDARSAYAFGDLVYSTIASGQARTISSGERVVLPAQSTAPNRASAAALPLQRPSGFSADCPPELACDVVPAAYTLNDENDLTNYGNYDLADRPSDGLEIRYIVIHDTEIPYTTTLNVFQNPLTYASAHYVVRASDGHIAQMIENNNVAWHAGNWYINGHSIGIEHEGVAIAGASWYSEFMYAASAKLVRYLATKYGIPLDRQHIIGHDEVPGPTVSTHRGQHWDPGPFWDWNHYMELVQANQRPANLDPDIVTISPSFASNAQPLRYCYSASDCQDVDAPATNFVYLRSAPSPSAPYIVDPLVTTADPLYANDWTNKAVSGQQYYRAASAGDWDGIYFGGQLAWLYNPGGVNTSAGSGILITPKAGMDSIPVYGRAYPEAAAYPANVPVQALVPLYEMPSGQIYVAAEQVQSTYYRAPTYTVTLDPSNHFPVIGATTYYQITFNHRLGFVMSSDVEVIASPDTLGVELAPATAAQTVEAGSSVSYTLTLTSTAATTHTFSISPSATLWSTSLTTTSVELAPGASATIAITVSVPASPAPYDSDKLLLWVRRDDISDRVAVATRTTSLASAPTIYLPLILR